MPMRVKEPVCPREKIKSGNDCNCGGQIIRKIRQSKIYQDAEQNDRGLPNVNILERHFSLSPCNFLVAAMAM